MRFWRPMHKGGMPGFEHPYSFFRLLSPFLSIVIEEPGLCEGNGYPFSVNVMSIRQIPWFRVRVWYWEVLVMLDGLRGLGPRTGWYWRWWRTTPKGWSTMGGWEKFARSSV